MASNFPAHAPQGGEEVRIITIEIQWNRTYDTGFENDHDYLLQNQCQFKVLVKTGEVG
jgi:hypothetical protein